MGGPWEKYQTNNANPSGPWSKYQTQEGQAPEQKATLGHKIGATIDGLAQGATLGYSDEIAGGLQTGFGLLGDYTQARDAERARMDENKRLAGGYRLGGEIGGGLAGGIGLLKSGLTATRLVPQALSGVKKMAATGLGLAADGVALGGLSAHGSDQDIPTGMMIGGVLGALSGPISAVASGVGKTAGGMLGIGNKGRAESALGSAIQRSGKSVSDLRSDLGQSVVDGQDVYTLADSLGNSGQRMLSGVARSPGDKRQAIAEMLESRQSGQGQRLSSTLEDGFAAKVTADKTKSNVKTARRAVGNMLYDAASEGAGAVDVGKAVKIIDDFNTPGVMSIADDGISPDSINKVLSRAKSILTDGKSQASNFDRVLRAKQDISDLAQSATRAGADNKARMLNKVSYALDEALENSSGIYRQANDSFRDASRLMDSVDYGKAAYGRGRADDKISAFGNMSPELKQGFRTGYADRALEKIEKSAVGANKARPLINDSMGKEFPAFAVDGQANKLGRKVARENTMFETMANALGGSKTADNLADAAEIQSIDPSMIANVLSGRWGQAASQGLASSVNMVQGKNTATRDMIAEMLMTNGARSPNVITQSVMAAEKAKMLQKMLERGIISGGVIGGNIAAN